MKFALAALALSAAPVYAQAPEPTVPPAPALAQGEAAATAIGSGQVKAVDAKAGALTIHHSPIPALGWPAMTMTFKAAPEAVSAAKVGQTVTFTLRTADNVIVALQPR